MSDNSRNEFLNRLKLELSSLARFIDKTRKGIESLEATVKISSEKFPEAAGHITSVKGELENAANLIMSAVESLNKDHDRMDALLKSLSEWAGGLSVASFTLGKVEGVDKGSSMIKELGALNEKMKGGLMGIYTNLSFHDISEQKLKKVIGSLAVVESKLLELALNFGFTADGRKLEMKADILNVLRATNEQMAIKQDIVDRILKELGV
jgi:chemotaxis regulatin CheY-phosphate phosphatase CheZ